MTPTKLSNKELIEETTKYYGHIPNIRELLSRLEQAQKENEDSIHRKHIPDYEECVRISKEFKLDLASLRYMAIYIESFCSLNPDKLPNPPKPTT